MSDFTRSTWKSALALWDKAKLDGRSLGVRELASLLCISNRTAYAIYFAIRNRNVINCVHETIEATDAIVELACGDLHIPFHDEAAISAMLDYAEQAGVNLITINGDLLDFYQVSSFTKKPLQSRPFQEIEIAKEWLTGLRQRFPQARIIFLQGNHEYRLERYICDKAPQIADLVENLLIDKLRLAGLKVEYMTEPYRIGNLWHLHGHEKPGGNYNPEYITNVMMGYIYDHFVVFHYHRTQDKIYRRLGDRWFKASACGHLAQQLDYAMVNKWNQGFSLIHYKANGDFVIDNKTIIKGEIY